MTADSHGREPESDIQAHIPPLSPAPPLSDPIPAAPAPLAPTPTPEADGKGQPAEGEKPGCYPTMLMIAVVLAVAGILFGGYCISTQNRQGVADLHRPQEPAAQDERLQQVKEFAAGKWFAARVDYGVPHGINTWDVVSVRRPHGYLDFRECNMVVEVWYEDTVVVRANRYWAVFATEDTYLVAFAPRGVALQKVRMYGTVQAGGRQGDLSEEWACKDLPK